MGFRFRKSIKIAPGVKVNLGKKSASVTIGGKHARTTISSTGRKTHSISTPIKGLSYTTTSSGKKKKASTQKKSTAPAVTRNANQIKQPAIKEPPKYSAKTYKICGTILKVLAVPVVLFSLLMIIGGLVGIGLFFLAFGAAFAYFGVNFTKTSKEMSLEPESTAEMVEESEESENGTYREFDASKVICVDVETTGLNSDEDEIVQLSIIDGNYTVLFNEYIKPERKTSWPSAQKVHGISPEQVKELPTIKEHLPVLNEIFANAEIIVGYNIEQFDAGFLVAAGIHIPEDTYYYDVMLQFAPIYGEWNDYHGDYKWQKLATCADYYGYDWGTDAAHDSLADVKATMYCFTKMI